MIPHSQPLSEFVLFRANSWLIHSQWSEPRPCLSCPAPYHARSHSGRGPDIVGTKRRSKIPRGNLFQRSYRPPKPPSQPKLSTIQALYYAKQTQLPQPQNQHKPLLYKHLWRKHAPRDSKKQTQSNPIPPRPSAEPRPGHSIHNSQADSAAARAQQEPVCLRVAIHGSQCYNQTQMPVSTNSTVKDQQ